MRRVGLGDWMAVNRQHATVHGESITWHADNAFYPKHSSMPKDHDLTSKRLAVLPRPGYGLAEGQPARYVPGVGTTLLEHVVLKARVSLLGDEGQCYQRHH